MHRHLYQLARVKKCNAGEVDAPKRLRFSLLVSKGHDVNRKRHHVDLDESNIIPKSE